MFISILKSCCSLGQFWAVLRVHSSFITEFYTQLSIPSSPDSGKHNSIYRSYDFGQALEMTYEIPEFSFLENVLIYLEGC